MVKNYKVPILVLCLLPGFFYHHVQAQELSTQGKIFWATFIENLGGTGGCSDNTVPELKIVISCNKATSGTVRNYITNVTMPFSIGTGGGIDTVLVPVNIGYVTGTETTSSRSMGLLITANDTVAVAAQNTKAYSCDASLIYPIEALGVDYRVLSHPGDASGSTACYRSVFAIVATENSTSIDITPSCATAGGHAANTTFTITLNKGETYMVKANTNKLDLSGTLIQAKDCKKIAVFGGSNRSSVHPGGACGAPFSNSYDQLYEELMPINLWGKKFVVAPTIWKKGKVKRFEMLKVVSSQSGTTVRCNGKLKVLAAAGQVDTFWIDSTSAKSAILNASKPVAVCQYAAMESCDGATSETDPMMMWVPPIEQSLKNLSFSCENAQTINKFFLNVIVKTQFRNTFLLDGANPSASWRVVAKDTSYSFIQQDNLSLGKHNISCPYGFSAMLYAYGDHGSYGYNAGSSIKPLSFYSIVNGKSSADFEADSLFYSVCQGATIPFDAGGSNTTGVVWKWLLKNSQNSMMTTFPKAIKTFNYTFKDSGTYKVTMIAQRPTNGVCNGQTSIDDTIFSEVRVYKKPDIHLLNDTTICLGNSVKLTSTTDGDTNYTFSPSTWLNCTKCFGPFSAPLKDTTYAVVATLKGCLPSRDTVHIRVRDSIFLFTGGDTTICRGTSAVMTASARGGLAPDLVVKWDHGLGTGLSKTVSPRVTTTYMAVLTDGCTRDANGNFYADTNYVKITVYDSLKIVMPKDTLVCEGNTVTMAVSVTGGKPGNSIVTWDHSLGQGLSKSYVAGSNDTKFRAVLSDGCTVPNDSGYVTVRVRPGIHIDTVMFPNPVCKNTVFRVNAKASGGDSMGYKFKLYNTTGSPSILIDSVQGHMNFGFNVKISDDQKFSLTMKQACNSQQVNNKFNISIKNGLSLIDPVPAVDTICTGQKYTLNIKGSSADNKPIKFVLQKKNGSSYLPVDSIVNLVSGTFSVNPSASQTDYRIVADDNCNRNDSTYFRLMVRDPINIIVLNDDELCRGESKTCTATATGGKVQDYTYKWYNTADNTVLGTNQALTFIPPQTMEVGVEIDDGCSAPVSTKAMLKLAPLITDSTMVTKKSGCEPLQTEFIYPTTVGIAPVNTDFTWKWTFGSTSTTTPAKGGDLLSNIPKTYNTAGTYTALVEMILSNNKVCFSRQVPVEVYDQAEADFDYQPKLIDVIEPEVSFTNASVGATTYNWFYSDGGSDNVENPRHMFGDTGKYCIVLVASNAHGCNDNDTQCLVVQDIFRIYIPNAFSPNADEFNTVWYPRLTSITSCELTVFNRWGQKLYFSDDISGKWDGKFLGADCEEGVYYYHLKIRDNRRKWHYFSGTLTLLR